MVWLLLEGANDVCLVPYAQLRQLLCLVDKLRSFVFPVLFVKQFIQIKGVVPGQVVLGRFPPHDRFSVESDAVNRYFEV